MPSPNTKKVPGMIYDNKIKYKIDFYQKVTRLYTNKLFAQKRCQVPTNKLFALLWRGTTTISTFHISVIRN
jgi:hypothetical protein